MSIKYSYAGKTDIGLVRSGNEDYYKVIEGNNLFLVCDGMGGHQAGEVASKEACVIIEHCFGSLANDIFGVPNLAIPAKFPASGDLLVRSIRIANRSVYIKSISDVELNGMGTTIVGAVLEDNIISIAHAGDSRAYKLTTEQLIPLTTDHSWVAELQKTGMFDENEAAQVAGKNVITRALGVHETVEVDFRADKIQKGDTFILCTDGLCGYANDSDIFAAARECKGDLRRICDNLVKLANQRGGQDNVTVVALRIDEITDESSFEPVQPVTISRESDIAIESENEIVNVIDDIKVKTEVVRTHVERQSKYNIIPLIFIILAVAFILVLVYLSVFK